MDINVIIIYMMMFFMLLGALDRCLQTGFGKSFGLTEHFEEGFNAMGALALAMVGVICAAPVLAAVLEPIIAPIYESLGASPAMFATTLLACDMGGQSLAAALAGSDVASGNFAGFILGAMMGPTIVFTIPVALGIIKSEDRRFLAKGVLIGMVTIPIGCLVGGLVAGYSLSMILHNLTPVIIVSVAIVIALSVIPNMVIKGFEIFSRFVVIAITIALAIAVIEQLSGFKIISYTTNNYDFVGFAGSLNQLLSGDTSIIGAFPYDITTGAKIVHMEPITEGIKIVGDIAIVLAGAFPLVYVLTKVAKKPLEAVGRSMGMNDVSAAGMVATLANNIPMFALLKDMDERGKIINIAFTVSAAFTLGDHLGYTAGVDKSMIAPMIAGKLTGGVTAVILALLILSKDKKNKSVNK